MEKLQNKYETISSKKRGADDGEEPKSQAYYVIKAAQVCTRTAGGYSRDLWGCKVALPGVK